MQIGKRLALAALLCVATGSTALAHGGLVIGVGVGLPICPRPYYYPAPYYYPYPYAYPYYAAPVVVQPAPVVVTQPAAQPGPAPTPAVATQPAPAVTSTYQTADWKKTGEMTQLLQLLNDPDEKTRSDAVIQLGRMKAEHAVDPLCATLAGDKSPLVRDSAAKALGLIGAPRSLTALLHAAQVDPDNNVRHSAQFAVEIIKLNSGQK